MKKFKKICNNIGRQISKPFKQPEIIIKAINQSIIKPIDKAIVKPIQKTIRKLQQKKQDHSEIINSHQWKKQQTKVEPQQFQKMQSNIQNQFVSFIKQKKFNESIEQKIGKHVCFIGPTSVGKTTLINDILNLSLPIGLGSCTENAQLVYKKDGITYWNAPGINKDFNFYKDIHLSFFNDMDVIYVLFDREVSDVVLIIKVLKAMKKRIKYVRTKCDNWNQGHKLSLAQELQRDLRQIRDIDQNCNEVIPSGYKMNDKIVKSISAQSNVKVQA